MKKFALLCAILAVLSGCTSSQPKPESSSQPESSAVSSEAVVSSLTVSAQASSLESSNDEQSAAEKAVAEKAAAEKAAADKAAAEKAAVEKAAADKAAAEKAAADKAAADKAAADKAAADKATADKAAADKVEQASSNKVVSGTNFLSKVESSIIKKINKERASLGLSQLTLSEDLQSAARIRSRELYKNDHFDHTRPNGDSWDTVIKEDVPISFVVAGENLCMTEYNDPNCNNASSATFWFNEWVNSPKHYENIVHPEFDHIGVGVYYVEKNGTTYAYATTLFAQLK